MINRTVDFIASEIKTILLNIYYTPKNFSDFIVLLYRPILTDLFVTHDLHCLTLEKWIG